MTLCFREQQASSAWQSACMEYLAPLSSKSTTSCLPPPQTRDHSDAQSYNILVHLLVTTCTCVAAALEVILWTVVLAVLHMCRTADRIYIFKGFHRHKPAPRRGSAAPPPAAPAAALRCAAAWGPPPGAPAAAHSLRRVTHGCIGLHNGMPAGEVGCCRRRRQLSAHDAHS